MLYKITSMNAENHFFLWKHVLLLQAVNESSNRFFVVTILHGNGKGWGEVVESRYQTLKKPFSPTITTHFLYNIHIHQSVAAHIPKKGTHSNQLRCMRSSWERVVEGKIAMLFCDLIQCIKWRSSWDEVK